MVSGGAMRTLRRRQPCWPHSGSLTRPRPPRCCRCAASPRWVSTAAHDVEAAGLQTARIRALAARQAEPATIAPASGLEGGRQQWALPLQGVPPFPVPDATPHCARLVVDELATERECERLIGTIRLALGSDALGSASTADKSFPLLIDAAPQLLGEGGHALAMALLERVQKEVERSFGGPVAPSGAMLFWLSPSTTLPDDSGGDFDSYAVPHIDQVNVADYHISSLLYLNTVGQHNTFDGALFAFNDPDGDKLVAPVAGRLLAFTSGFENLHQVQPIERGDRFALSVWFKRCGGEAVGEEPAVGVGGWPPWARRLGAAAAVGVLVGGWVFGWDLVLKVTQ